jgi:hypothetical protein
MKKMAGIVCAAFSLMIATTPVLAQTMTESSSTTYKPFQGTIKPFDQIQFQSAAMQSDGVHDYLKTMKMIMTKYTDVVYEVVMSNGGMPPTPDQMSTASAETQRLANHIGSVKAPQEIAADHKSGGQLSEIECRRRSCCDGAGVPDDCGSAIDDAQLPLGSDELDQ